MATVGEQAVAWMAAHQGRFSYSNQQPQKLDPERYGFSDCSGVIYAAYKTLGYTLGTMSYDQAKNGAAVADGTTSAKFNTIMGNLRPGDIVAMARPEGVGGGSQINHVEMYDKDGYSWGHGGVPAMGPTRHKINVNGFIADSAFWIVRRIDTVGNPEEELTPEQAANLKKVYDIVSTLDMTESKVDQLWQRRATIDLLSGILNKVNSL